MKQLVGLHINRAIKLLSRCHILGLFTVQGTAIYCYIMSLHRKIWADNVIYA